MSSKTVPVSCDTHSISTLKSESENLNVEVNNLLEKGLMEIKTLEDGEDEINITSNIEKNKLIELPVAITSLTHTYEDPKKDFLQQRLQLESSESKNREYENEKSILENNQNGEGNESQNTYEYTNPKKKDSPEYSMLEHNFVSQCDSSNSQQEEVANLIDFGEPPHTESIPSDLISIRNGVTCMEISDPFDNEFICMEISDSFDNGFIPNTTKTEGITRGGPYEEKICPKTLRELTQERNFQEMDQMHRLDLVVHYLLFDVLTKDEIDGFYQIQQTLKDGSRLNQGGDVEGERDRCDFLEEERANLLRIYDDASNSNYFHDDVMKSQLGSFIRTCLENVITSLKTLTHEEKFRSSQSQLQCKQVEKLQFTSTKYNLIKQEMLEIQAVLQDEKEKHGNIMKYLKIVMGNYKFNDDEEHEVKNMETDVNTTSKESPNKLEGESLPFELHEVNTVLSNLHKICELRKREICNLKIERDSMKEQILELEERLQKQTKKYDNIMGELKKMLKAYRNVWSDQKEELRHRKNGSSEITPSSKETRERDGDEGVKLLDKDHPLYDVKSLFTGFLKDQQSLGEELKRAEVKLKTCREELNHNKYKTREFEVIENSKVKNWLDSINTKLSVIFQEVVDSNKLKGLKVIKEKDDYVLIHNRTIAKIIDIMEDIKYFETVLESKTDLTPPLDNPSEEASTSKFLLWSNKLEKFSEHVESIKESSYETIFKSEEDFYRKQCTDVFSNIGEQLDDFSQSIGLPQMSKSNKEYLHVEEMLLRMITDLDKMQNLRNDASLKQERKKLIARIHEVEKQLVKHRDK